MQFRHAAHEPGAPNNNPAAFRPRRIKFLHPGYRQGNAVFLSLLALDDGGGNNGGGGIDFDTALAACGLIAGNRWSDGFFSSDRGTVIVERPGDGILREPQYFLSSSNSPAGSILHTPSYRVFLTGPFHIMICRLSGRDGRR
ncbi:hypothetical protein F5144DRAFT_569826 [Chaetomium tenue]|uniref:Uncharacterized protein n=1 Tax=Chaetomium tenue TaxID=1854479 RepID=A0ACB7PDB0_9PEZI|nr:hypothetical protein F5144DRAFT_569826 [Chaetomium globosum]